MKWKRAIMVVVLAAVMLGGCDSNPKRSLSLDLVDGKFESVTENSEVEVGAIEYKETTDPTGVSTIEIRIESYKVAADRVAAERDKALIKGVLEAAGIVGGAVVTGGVPVP